MGTPGVRRRVAAVRRDAHRAVDVLDVGDADEPNLVARLVANLVEHQSVTGANLARLQHEPAVVNQRAHLRRLGRVDVEPELGEHVVVVGAHHSPTAALMAPVARLRAPDRMGVHGCGDACVGVTEHACDAGDVGAFAQHHRRRAVSQHVRRTSSVDACGVRDPFQRVIHRVSWHRSACLVDEHEHHGLPTVVDECAGPVMSGGEAPLRLSCLVLAQHRGQRRCQPERPAAPSCFRRRETEHSAGQCCQAALDRQLGAVEVDALPRQAEHLGTSQPE